jgi:acetylornithine/succinyldiaminopimelate/putrescine aminotransferase
LFAYQFFDIEPDVVALAKGLGNGFPIGAMLARKNVSTVLEPGNHASTFGGNPLATTCSKVVLTKMLKTNILKNVTEVGNYFKQKLAELKELNFKDIRGEGLMIGVEMNFPVKDIVNKCIENGLLIGSACKNVLRFVPPLIVEKKHIDEAIEILKKVLSS